MYAGRDSFRETTSDDKSGSDLEHVDVSRIERCEDGFDLERLCRKFLKGLRIKTFDRLTLISSESLRVEFPFEDREAYTNSETQTAGFLDSDVSACPTRQAIRKR